MQFKREHIFTCQNYKKCFRCNVLKVAVDLRRPEKRVMMMQTEALMFRCRSTVSQFDHITWLLLSAPHPEVKGEPPPLHAFSCLAAGLQPFICDLSCHHTHITARHPLAWLMTTAAASGLLGVRLVIIRAPGHTADMTEDAEQRCITAFIKTQQKLFKQLGFK